MPTGAWSTLTACQIHATYIFEENETQNLDMTANSSFFPYWKCKATKTK